MSSIFSIYFYFQKNLENIIFFEIWKTKIFDVISYTSPRTICSPAAACLAAWQA